MEYVPGVLAQGIPKEMVSEIGSSRSDSHGCEYYGESESGRLPRLYRCYCRSGNVGNAYLADCQDVGKCEDPPLNTCPWMCENRPGTYICVDHDWIVPFVAIGVSIALGLLFLSVYTWKLHGVIKRKKKIKLREEFFKKNGGLLFQQQVFSGEGNVEKTTLFKVEELEKATDEFNENRILRQRGRGTVYKGMLADGRIVAIKKSEAVDERKLEQFINEVVILSQINHRNVVKLLGCCLETEVPLLVYEFIPNGTLSQYIHNQSYEFPLTWDMRLQIAAEVAGTLCFLHSAASIPIYHRDDILLDEKHRAKVADFGTSTSVAIEQTRLTTLVKSTLGYLDPEFFRSSQFTEKSDVYSFGVVLAELLTGKKPICSTRSEEDRRLVSYFIAEMNQSRLFNTIDPRVIGEAKKEEITALAYLTRRCLDMTGRRRPTMKEVMVELEGIRMSRSMLLIQRTLA